MSLRERLRSWAHEEVQRKRKERGLEPWDFSQPRLEPIEPLSIVCPYCAALPGENCRTVAGKRYVRVHGVRKKTEIFTLDKCNTL
jgi:hypothetical protein